VRGDDTAEALRSRQQEAVVRTDEPIAACRLDSDAAALGA